MDKTININLGGTLFQIDEEAFHILRDYLQTINARFANIQGGNETIDDIESRIAEIFLSQKSLAGVITKENVESMIAIIGKPEDFDHGEPETGNPVYTSHKKRMYRNTEDSIVGGVCSGIAAYLDTDPVIFRILFVLFTLCFGVGFLIYLILWISLPSARTDSQKREMYDNSYHTARSQNLKYDSTSVTEAPQYHSVNSTTSKIGNAINEIFRAVVNVCYVIVRIILIILGVALVLTGFLSILCFVLIFIFKFPGIYSMDSSGTSLIYAFDFMKYIANPSAVPWIIILTSIAFILPMLGIIYWGIKMIFWFRARDGVVNLVALVVWVMSLAALTIICFNEGISFARTSKTVVETVLANPTDTLYVVTDQKVADLKFDKNISLPHDEYSVLINDDKKELYIRPYLSVQKSYDKLAKLEVKKRSAGRTEFEAKKKTDELLYNYSIKGNTIHLDEYFTIPTGRKWSADNVGINLYIPTHTILKFEKDPRILLHTSFRNESDEYLESRWESSNSIWVMTDDGLESVTEHAVK